MGRLARLKSVWIAYFREKDTKFAQIVQGPGHSLTRAFG